MVTGFRNYESVIPELYFVDSTLYLFYQVNNYIKKYYLLKIKIKVHKLFSIMNNILS